MKKIRVLALILGFIGLLLISCFIYYQYNISPTDKSSKANIEVVIPEGMSTTDIAKTLYDKGLIKNEFFFKVYLKLNKVSSLKASTYLLTKSMSMKEIVIELENGNTNDNVIKLTFKEGENIKDYANMISKKTNITSEEFISTIKDTTFLTKLIDDYWFLTDSILNENIYYPLEGYLAPDTYNFDVNADVKAIFEKMLDQTDKILTDLKPSLGKSGLKVHEVLTLASMAESEGVSLEDRKNIVGVFMNRIKNNMALGSDVTTYYASKIELGERDLYMSEINSDNPYNTRSAKNAGKLPVGPICNPSKSAIEATINYTQNDYLYFVADKNMKVYFTKTDAEHNKKIQELKNQGLWFEY